jgi:asparagine synthase (glutamine-hydrolysing)
LGAIAGVFNFDGRPVTLSDVRTMTAASSRPPSDGEDFWLCSSFGIGYQHSRVTPESLTETQPLVSPSQTAICFDGRLDNREELTRFDPQRTAESARGLSDAALVLAAYEQAGDRCASELNGDFAFALFDSQRQQLLLARDVMAAQCLYYCPVDRGVVFASEIKSILADPRVSARPDEDGLAALVLDDWCDEHRTCFKGIYTVPPGHLLVATRDRIALREHWAFDPARDIRLGSFAEYSERFRALFEQAVRRRLRSAHPVAVAVGGGVDSSAIFCQASTLVRRESPSIALRGIAVTFPAGTPAGEQEFLEEIERVCGATISRVPSSASGLLVDAHAAVRHLETPGAFWQAEHDMFEQTRRLGCRVILNGFFADQMLFDRGYLVDLARRGRWLKVRHDLREFAAWMTDVEPGFFDREFWSRIVRALPPRWLFRFAKRHIGRRKANGRYPRWFAKGFRERAIAQHPARFTTSRRFASAHAQQYYRHATAGHYVSNVRCMNAAGLMHGVDVWYPFRDRDLVAFLMAIPGEVVNRGGVPKGLLRHALTGMLPEAIRNRRWKADFTAVYNRGATREHANVARLLSRDCLSVRAGLVDGNVVEASLATFATTLSRDASGLSSRQLTGLAGLELWLRYFFGNGTSSPDIK